MTGVQIIIMHCRFLCCTKDSWWKIVFAGLASILQLTLTVTILPSVSFGSSLGQNAVLFFCVSEKTLSFSALQCGIVSTKRAMLDSLGNWLCPSGLFMAWMKFQMMSALYLISLVSAFASALTADGMSSSFNMTKSLNSWESSSSSRAEQLYGNKFGYLKK